MNRPPNPRHLALRSLAARTLLGASTLALVGGCSNVQTLFNQNAEQHSQMIAGMEQCLAVQTQERQARQQQQQQIQHSLAQQAQKLEQLDATLKVANELHTMTAAAVVEIPAACSPVEGTPTGSRPSAGSKLLVGGLEQVWLQDLQLALPARVDTGAETASLDARNITLFERNSKKWVRFEIVHPQSGEPFEVERKLIRQVSIIQSNSSEAERRPVIKLAITVGHIKQSAEFTLSNRSHLDYQVLIGRNILKDVMIVDVSKSNIAPFPADTIPSRPVNAGP